VEENNTQNNNAQNGSGQSNSGQNNNMQSNNTQHMGPNKTLGLSILGVIILIGIIVIVILLLKNNDTQSVSKTETGAGVSMSVPGVGTISVGENGASITGGGMSITANGDGANIAGDGASITANGDGATITGNGTTITANGGGASVTTGDLSSQASTYISSKDTNIPGNEYTIEDDYIRVDNGNDYAEADISPFNEICVYLGDNYITVDSDSIYISEADNTVSKSGVNNTITIDGNYAILNNQKVLIIGNTIENIYQSVKTILGYGTTTPTSTSSNTTEVLSLKDGLDSVAVYDNQSIDIYYKNNCIKVLLNQCYINEEGKKEINKNVNSTIKTDGNYVVLNNQKVLIKGNTIGNVYNTVKKILGY